MMTNVHSAEDLARSARLLPKPLLDDAAAGMSQHLEEDFEFATAGLYKFGERLIYTGGLVIAALYLELTSGRTTSVDHRLLDHIKTILFNRPYDSGLAICILERLATAGPHIGVSPAGRPVCISNFLSLKRDTPANTYRARHQRSLETELAEVLDYLSFLRDVTFAETDTASFRGHSVPLWPFLRWDGSRLSAFREMRLPLNDGALPKRAIFVRHEDYEEHQDLSEIVPLDRVRLAAIAERVGHIHTDLSRSPHTGDRESFIPLLVQNYARMDDLVDLIMKGANNETKSDWMHWYLQKGARAEPTAAEIQRALGDDTLVENAILAYALEYDPIVLLKDYFESEREDIRDCIRLLDPADAEKILNGIDTRVERVRERIEPMFVHGEHELKKLLRDHRARFASIEVAYLLGFKIRHVAVRDSIEDYADRVADFYGYIMEHPDEERIDRGLVQCCIVGEEVLEFLHLYYRAIEGFDRASDTGLSITSRTILDEEAAEVKGKGLGTLIRLFKQLCQRFECGLPHLGSRRQLCDDAEPHIKMLERLNLWRNRGGEVHRSPTLRLTIGERIDLVRDVALFLQWLRRPNENRPGTFERIYPAVLQLNVLTTNRCGVTSVKYVLRESSEGTDSIRLYTQQRVSGIAGVFYGLPVQGRGNAELWVDPILFAADAFEDAATRSRRT